MCKRLVGSFMIVSLCLCLVGCERGKRGPDTSKKKDSSSKNPTDVNQPVNNGSQSSKSSPATVGGVQVMTLDFFKQFVKADSSNTSLKNEERTNPVPVRGGTLVVRLPTAPPGFNRHLVTQNTSGQAEINNLYLNLPMIDQDDETLENIPQIARYWKTQDVIDLLPDGTSAEDEDPEKTQYLRRYGRIAEVVEGKKIVFYEGGWLYTLPQFETVIDDKKGTVSQKNGPTLKPRGTVTKPGRYTYQVEDVTQAKKIEIPWSRLAQKSWYTGKGAGKKSMNGLRPGCRHVISIRDNFTWHDGKPFTIDDVMFTIKYILKNTHVNAQNIQNYYNDLTHYEKLDANTIQYDWAKPYFKSLGLSGAIQPVPRHVFWRKEYEGDLKTFGKDYETHKNNDAPIGNGPYRFAEWNKASHITLERYDACPINTIGYPYWKPQMPYLDKIQFVVIGNALAAVKALTSGDVDLDKDVEPDTWKSQLKDRWFKENFVCQKSMTPVYTYVGWNLRKPVFQNKLVRRALTMLIPREKIGRDIHHGLAFPVSGPFFYNSPAYDKSIKPLPYDLVAAKKLLKKAGYVDRNSDGWIDWRDKGGKVHTFEFEYLIHTARKYHENIAVKVKENLQKAGIKVNIRKIDWTIFAKTVNDRKFDAVRYAWGSEVDPDPYQIWHSSQGPKGSNHVGYANPEVDQIIETARMTLDNNKRWALLRKMHRIVNDEQPYSFMFCFYTLAFGSQRTRGVKFFPTLSYGTRYTQWWIPRRFQKKPGN